MMKAATMVATAGKRRRAGAQAQSGQNQQRDRGFVRHDGLA
jgi:hypothetical protein